MRHNILRAGSLIGAAGAALVLAGSGLAIASSSAAAKITGPEVLSGSVRGKAALANDPHIPLAIVGAVVTTDRGFVLGNTPANKPHTVTTPVGKLTVKPIGKQAQTSSVDPRTCRASFALRQKFTFDPGLSTGKFAGATGPGAYQLSFTATVPRYTSGKNKGQCNPNGNPLAKGAVASFLVAGVITVSQ